ncbi:hypothetical protein, conserved [Leishmania tarentolae]|uniref:Uncharacterized protein n=1 Tax=Leishmania tarentolae TaxID=5689 RepID=A0A640KSY3_LEITA|nr:hypothetical protein, conserved [Leishmania tarentolae]
MCVCVYVEGIRELPPCADGRWLQYSDLPRPPFGFLLCWATKLSPPFTRIHSSPSFSKFFGSVTRPVLDAVGCGRSASRRSPAGMDFLSTASAVQRPPVGVPPYRVPPLSGLYRMRYHPPSPTATSSNNLRGESDCDGSGDGIPGSPTACGATTDLPAQASSNSAAARHAAVHKQLVGASSLRDGGIDLFALYSLCEVEPVPCKLCTLHTQTTLNTSSYRLRQSYQLQKGSADHFLHLLTGDSEARTEAAALSTTEPSRLIHILQEGWYVFFFPMSECGRLKDNLLVYVGDHLIAGDVAECDLANDGCLRPLKTAAAASALPGVVNCSPGGTTTPWASKSTSATSQRWKSLFYYVVSPVPVHWGARETEDLHLTVLWRSIPAAYPKHRQKSLTLLYSYYCSPRAPDTFTCRAHFPRHTRLRLVRSPNCDSKVHLRSHVTERMARVQVETVDGKPLETHRHTRDYVFVLQFLFGDNNVLLEEVNVFAAAVVAIVFLLLLWVFLTKDLIL